MWSVRVIPFYVRQIEVYVRQLQKAVRQVKKLVRQLIIRHIVRHRAFNRGQVVILSKNTHSWLQPISFQLQIILQFYSGKAESQENQQEKMSRSRDNKDYLAEAIENSK